MQSSDSKSDPSSDPFDDLLTLESNFYREGYEAGITDSTHAALIEGKLFGIEKGFEKALEIGRAHGRALIWQARLNTSNETVQGKGEVAGTMNDLPSLQDYARLKKHIDILLSLTEPSGIPKDNSDASVSEVDERVTKIRARMKMISNLVGESVGSGVGKMNSIEETGGLNARR